MNENYNTKPLIDFATIITVLGLFFYFFGFIYSSFYYSELGIKDSLIDLSMNKILFTTWQIPLILATALTFTYSGYVFTRLINDEINIITTIISIIGSLCLLYFALWLVEIKDPKYNNIYIILFSIFFGILLVLSCRIKKVKKISRSTFHYIIIATSFFASCFFYPYMGIYIAKKTVEKYEENIEINLKNEHKKLYGKFISYMNDKYFILVEDKNCKINTTVINNDEISVVTFLSKK